jgi:hypothetical protein
VDLPAAVLLLPHQVHEDAVEREGPAVAGARDDPPTAVERPAGRDLERADIVDLDLLPPLPASDVGVPPGGVVVTV